MECSKTQSTFFAVILSMLMTSLSFAGKPNVDMLAKASLLQNENASYTHNARGHETVCIADQYKAYASTKQFILENIEFESGKAILKPDSYIPLDSVVGFMKACSKATFKIIGNTDNVGNAMKNRSLSEDRAAAVKQYFIEHGISASRLESEGVGSENPIAPNKTAEGRRKNRRLDFIRTDLY